MMYLDLATSVVLSLTAAAPFNGTADQNLAVAYIGVFTLVFLVRSCDIDISLFLYDILGSVRLLSFRWGASIGLQWTSRDRT